MFEFLRGSSKERAAEESVKRFKNKNRLTNKEEEILSNAQRVTRRLFLKRVIVGGGVLVVVSGGGIGAILLGNKQEPGLYGQKPAPEIDRNLLREVFAIESRYRNETLVSGVDLSEHLALSAELFSRYSGELMSTADLVSSIHYLSREEFIKRYSSSNYAASTDEKTGEININVEAQLLRNQFTSDLRKGGFPYWSALTTARAFYYQHEWYHRAGAVNRKDYYPLIDMSKYYNQPFDLTHTYGFSIKMKDRTQELYGTDHSLEEAFAYLMTTRLEKKFTGSELTLTRLEHVAGEEANATNRGRKRLDAIIKARPQWVADLQRFHREADPVGFGRFLVDGTNYVFSSEDQRNQYALDLLMSLTLTPTEVLHQDYLKRMRRN